MTDQEIRKYGEIQYLKGRLDELHKALPTVTNMERSRKLDQRVEKYINKLKKVDEVAYYLYEVELINRQTGFPTNPDAVTQSYCDYEIFKDEIFIRWDETIQGVLGLPTEFEIQVNLF